MPRSFKTRHGQTIPYFNKGELVQPTYRRGSGIGRGKSGQKYATILSGPDTDGFYSIEWDNGDRQYFFGGHLKLARPSRESYRHRNATDPKGRTLTLSGTECDEHMMPWIFGAFAVGGLLSAIVFYKWGYSNGSAAPATSAVTSTSGT